MSSAQPVILGEMPSLSKLYVNAAAAAARRRILGSHNSTALPLVSHEVIVNLIAATTTKTGLQVKSRLDTGKYPKGVKVSKADFASIDLRPDDFHGDWNYSIQPRS